MPLISVIVPIYKVEPYLRKCVDSILSQSFRDFELILIDDGSPDRCGEICDEYAGGDSRIHVIHKKNGGLSAARNAGLDIAAGEWILFIDSDDWIDEGYLEALYYAADRHGTGIALSTVRQVHADGRSAIVGPAKSMAMSPSEIYSKHCLLAVWACGKLFRRDLIGNLRFPEGRIQEDEFFTYRVLFQCPEVAVVAKVSYNYLQRPDSIVGGKWYHERIFALDGMKEQRAYFKANRFDLAYEAVTRRLFLWMLVSLDGIRAYCPGNLEDKALIDREINALLSNAQDAAILGQVVKPPSVRYKLRSWRQPRLRFIWRVLYALETMRGNGIREAVRQVGGFIKSKFRVKH